MPKKSAHSVRQFKGASSSKNAQSSSTSNSPASASQKSGVPVQIAPYTAFLFNYIHFTKEERQNRGEGVLQDNVLKITSTHEEELYALLVQLAKDVRILSANSNVDESDYTQDRLKSLFTKVFEVFTAPSNPSRDAKQEKKQLKKMKNYVEMLQKDTVHNMVQFLVNYQFNQCEGVNVTVLRLHELLNHLGKFSPIWNVQMVESGLLSGWLIRILKQDAGQSPEAIEVYRLFALQWLNVIVSEYHLFRRRAKESAMMNRQKKIDEKRAVIKEKKKKRDEEEEKRIKEFEQQLLDEQQQEDENLDEDAQAVAERKKKKKKRTYDDDHLFEEQEDDDDEAELAELERLEKEESDGSDDPNVQKLRSELFDDTFVKIVVDLLKKVQEYENEDTFVLITTVAGANPQKKLSYEDHVEKCDKMFLQQLLHILTELLTSTYSFDEDVFNTLVQSMIERNVQTVFSYTFSHPKNVNCLRRSFNLLYFLLHCKDKSVRMALLPHLLMVVDVFQSTVNENANGKVSIKDENLAVACLYNLAYITSASSAITAQIYEHNPDFFETLITLFKDRPFDESVLIVVYGCVASFIRYGIDTNTLLNLEDRWGFTDDVINDVHTNDSRVRFPGIVTIRVLLERLESVPMQQAALIYQKILDSGVSNVMLQTIFDKRFSQDDKQDNRRGNPQFEATRMLHQRFMHPGSLCTLNVLLDQSTKTASPQVNQSLAALVNSDQRYVEIIQFMRFMQQSREKRFSYKYVFMLIGLIVFVVLLFPLVARLFGLNTSVTPPPQA
eukprot:CAMPEP_0117444688 /NCGR_PEP_ID=MMETSP0759-20121206/5375_1 /TAXON_ID=63605 /ORGANISM="Percolomonas cosmopolitus, Strain WS" /LENGTH=780 /DNA_ID=CAMNT_0005236773 /DNA_START=76 /DNA_END=2418 /DNA_ORIENTATION=-